MSPASLLPLAAGGEFTEARDHSFAQSCTSTETVHSVHTLSFLLNSFPQFSHGKFLTSKWLRNESRKIYFSKLQLLRYVYLHDFVYSKFIGARETLGAVLATKLALAMECPDVLPHVGIFSKALRKRKDFITKREQANFF